MNSTFKFKLIQALNKKNGNKGFTLIELLVVVIIIGVLAAIALPNLLNQVAKGRQSEARNNLGVVNRTRQSYRLETGTFGTFSALPLSIQAQYYSYADSSTAPNDTAAVTNATAISTYNNDIRDYSAGVAQNGSGQFGAIICEANTPDQTTAVAATPTAGAADGGTCAAGRVLK
ncbi:MAG: prepilin-type N-terminal cleavage/methylation domain-containing protein [Microcystis aeruginosa G11-01]|nr:prepilin-type N-terminal cleavage/methylation domain-containing protein [Microcystis aeruginosa G13-10]NCS35692.1 prepilin-type N-terminal cleavage/methylation domain-containing protein [Microcystis aeruginosa G11-01]